MSNKFGTWYNALTKANIPPNLNPPQIINCKQCNKEIVKEINQIKKSNNSFCSRSCSAIYYNKIIDRTLTVEVKNKIRKKLLKPHKCLIYKVVEEKHNNTSS